MKFRSNPNVLLTELADGTGVLLDLESKFYFALNATGICVWKQLAKGALDVDALATELARQFTVEASVATEDVNALLEELVGEKLVTRVP